MYGIDISTYQSGLDINTVRNQGNEFVGVKSVASYLPQLTVADDYRNNVDRVMAAALPKYHYAVPNNQNSPEATARFQWDIRYRYDPDSDLFMLDNEPLNTYGVFWGPGDAARYFRALNAFGVPYSKMILYCPAALTRSRGRWDEIIALREQGLIIQWVSYGDMDPYYEDGEEPNTGNTGLDNPEMHQFTSSYTVPGYNGLIDRVYSRLTANQLFGGGNMPRSWAGVVAWAQNEARNGNILNDWAGWCEKFINNSGAFNQGFGSALIAGSASGPLRTDYQNAGPGAIVYWSGVGGDGHDAWIYEQGADPLLLMVSGTALLNDWGHNIGTIRLSAYQRAFGHPLRGWTYRHGTETLNFGGTAGGGGTTPVVDEEDEMLFLGVPADGKDGRPAVALSSGRRYVIPAGHEGIVKGTCSKAITELNAAQYDIITAAWLQGEYVPTPSTVDQAAIDAAIDKSLADANLPAPEVDWVAGAEVINNDLAARLVK